MKITIYTITECAFSKQEKEYLSSHGLQFEEKNLETNREFLTEMLAVGSNFAGTPVTKIEKDDGQIVVLKGFTASEFDQTLGFVQSAPQTQVATQPVDQAPQQQSVPAPQVEPTPEVVQPIQAPEVVVASPQPDMVQTPVTAVTNDPAMASLLNNLEQVAQVQAPIATSQEPLPPQSPVPATMPQAPMPTAPVIPDPQF